MSEGAIKALLFDLDDTLLINDMSEFSPHYFAALTARVKPICSPEVFMDALNAAMRAVWNNDGQNGSNAEVFWKIFAPRLDCDIDEVRSTLEAFYAEDFEDLRKHTKADPHARPLMDLAFEKGYQVAIVTQPVFPREAILARLRWAGVGADRYDYDYITTYENVRACKPHPLFFTTVMEHLGRDPAECLVVGDSPDADLPARRLGMRTFWIDRGRIPKLPPAASDAQGNLQDLIELIKTGEIHDL
ncbi:MAG: HAD family hydrolase [Chloroflexota bacterium]|nr:HAD family hydrolase [Chloroflexota bacterium]